MNYTYIGSKHGRLIIINIYVHLDITYKSPWEDNFDYTRVNASWNQPKEIIYSFILVSLSYQLDFHILYTLTSVSYTHLRAHET